MKSATRPHPIFGTNGGLNCSNGQSVFGWNAYQWKIEQNGDVEIDGSHIPFGNKLIKYIKTMLQKLVHPVLEIILMISARFDRVLTSFDEF